MLKRSLVVIVVCGLVFPLAAMMTAGGLNPAPAVRDDKAPLVETGTITKIDLKKKVLTVQGYVIALPDDAPLQKSGSPAGSRNFQAPGGGGRRGGGRPSGEPSGRGGNRGGGTPSEPLREFNVFVHSDTAIQDDKATLSLNDLNVEDYVVVLGKPKGKSINVDATSISVSNR